MAIFGSESVGARCVRWVAGAGALVASSHAFALGLGEPTVASVLGQPLQLTVPLVMDPGTELTQDCVRIVAGPQSGDSIPSLGTGRITLEPERGQLRIESLQPITEPALRVMVEAGCNERIRREFALLLDPPGMTIRQSNSAGEGSAQPGRPEPSIGLGMAKISAVLGQRLSIRVPAVGAGAGGLTADCVRLADPISSEGAPVLRQATIRVLPGPTGAVIEVATPDPVTEPAVRLALDVGCREPLRREYAILLGLPALTASNVGATEPPAEPPAASRATKAAAPVTAVAPGAAHPTPVRPIAPAARPAQAAHAGGSDRLVLGSPQDDMQSVPGGDSAAMSDANAQMLKRIEAMSKQIEALQTQLAASRQRQQELERQASETAERWTWTMGAFAALLLASALIAVWRQRQPVRPSTWEPVVHPPQQPAEARPKAVIAKAPAYAAASGIGGRATMPPAPTVVGATTEPSLPDDRHTHITVTELHDTVQVIKELYATVLERNTAGSTGGQTQRPLELDLGTPTATGAAEASSGLPAQRPSTDRSQSVSAPQVKRALDERFTELPTEVGLDLDLSSVLIPIEATVFDPLEERGDAEVASAETPAAAEVAKGAGALTEAARAEPTAKPTGAVSTAEPGRGASAAGPARGGFPDERLTQTATEVLIDIDVGTGTGFPATTSRPAASRVVPLQRPESDRPRGAGGPLEPIDLQLDLTQPETRGKRRGERSA